MNQEHETETTLRVTMRESAQPASGPSDTEWGRLETDCATVHTDVLLPRSKSHELGVATHVQQVTLMLRKEAYRFPVNGISVKTNHHQRGKIEKMP